MDPIASPKIPSKLTLYDRTDTMKKIFLTCVVALSCTLLIPVYAAAAAGAPQVEEEEEGEVTRASKRQRVHEATSLHSNEPAPALALPTIPGRRAATLLNRTWPTRFGAVMCRSLTGKNVAQLIQPLIQPYLAENRHGSDRPQRYEVRDRAGLTVFNHPLREPVLVKWPWHTATEGEFQPEEVITSSVEDLVLELCGSCSIPSWVGQMDALKTLCISSGQDGHSGAEITISDTFQFPASLQELSFTAVSLKRFPRSLRALPFLKDLTVLSNSDLNISPSFEFPHSLEKLELVYNDLTHLPAGITRLPVLKVLIVEETEFEGAGFIPQNFAFPSSLEQLTLRGLNLTKIPRSVQNLPRLTYLELSGNDFSGPSIFGVDFPPSLQTLDLGACGLMGVPLGIHNHPALRTLNLQGNRAITFISDQFVFPPLLEELHLNGCPLRRVPAGVERLRHLHTIYLDESTPIPAWLQAKMDRHEINVVVNGQHLSTRRE